MDTVRRHDRALADVGRSISKASPRAGGAAVTMRRSPCASPSPAQWGTCPPAHDFEALGARLSRSVVVRGADLRYVPHALARRRSDHPAVCWPTRKPTTTSWFCVSAREVGGARAGFIWRRIRRKSRSLASLGMTRMDGRQPPVCRSEAKVRPENLFSMTTIHKIRLVSWVLAKAFALMLQTCRRRTHRTCGRRTLVRSTASIRVGLRVRAFASMEPLCDDRSIEAIYVAARIIFHAEHVRIAATAGKHSSRREADGLVDRRVSSDD